MVECGSATLATLARITVFRNLAGQLMITLRRLPGHTFWPGDISLLDTERVDAARLLSSGQVTDSYLLALACAHDGQLASLDRRLVTDAVHGGKRGLHLIA